MIDKVQIISWILTRKCNLRCSYCSIVKDYTNKPKEYPDMSHYYKQEMSSNYIIQTLDMIKKHNPNAFHLLYGGEPMLRPDLYEIINYCNSENIHYTIITNNSDEVQNKIEELFLNVSYIQGITSSVDPMILCKENTTDYDRYNKCVAGLKRLQQYKGVIDDIVAEITVDNRSIDYLYDLVKMLTDMGISSDITTIDIAKTNFYDFSSITDKSLLVPKNTKVKDIFQKIIEDELDVHMAETLLPKIWNILPANLDCGLEKNIHNMTIDADGSLRLCLRIRGTSTPNLKAYDCFQDDGSLRPMYKQLIAADKQAYCKGCNWSCVIMSQMLSEGLDSVDNLIHNDRRN